MPDFLFFPKTDLGLCQNLQKNSKGTTAAALGGVYTVGRSQGKGILTAVISSSPEGTGIKHSDSLLVTQHVSATDILIFNIATKDASPIKNA